MKMTPRQDSVRECKTRIGKRFGTPLPALALVLGSGFQEILSEFDLQSEMSFSELPGFPVPKVKGHAGRLMVGSLRGLPFLICSGRAHYYEGYSMDEVIFPIEVLAACRVGELLLTNAAGGINRGFRRGDFMIFSDHINLLGVNPLRGIPVQDGKCFVDLTETYCRSLRKELKSAARRARLSLREGVYLGVSGPTYETPAEIRAFRKLGADAVGMSTIPEVLIGRYYGMRVAAISCITNHAAGMTGENLSHQEVLKAGRENAGNAARLLAAFAESRQGSLATRTGNNLRKKNATISLRD